MMACASPVKMDKLLKISKAKLFESLHHNDKILVLPNIWDPLGAILLESLGYAAVATASASIAFSNGYADGENISFKELKDAS
jgi:2-methylisocitrate lyase-like PEP mutase family enzyme